MFKAGDMVQFVDKRLDPHFEPPSGTVGEIVLVSAPGLLVRWPMGTTTGDDTWWINKSRIELVDTTLPMDCSCLAENLSELFDE